MLAHLKVLLRYVLTIAFSALGGALVTRGWLTEGQAGLLLSDPLLEAAASFGAAVSVYIFGAFFSEAAKAYAAWEDLRTAINHDPEV